LLDPLLDLFPPASTDGYMGLASGTLRDVPRDRNCRSPDFWCYFAYRAENTTGAASLLFVTRTCITS